LDPLDLSYLEKFYNGIENMEGEMQIKIKEMDVLSKNI